MQPLRIGVIGLGNISGVYFDNLNRYPLTEIVAVADLDPDRARASGERHGVRALTPDELVRDPEVELVLNLTIPVAHGPVSLDAARHGKHVYSEKPLAVDRPEAQALMQAAEANGVRVGCAPDTFLGGGHQACRDIVDRGLIGEIVAVQCHMLGRGHESWHPSPEFYYQRGGGPMFDMGPYYLSDVINLAGPVRRVTGSVRASFPTRTITSQPKAGTVVEVEVPTHIAGVFEFESGAIGEITTSFDVFHAPVPPIVVYGSEGTLLVPDPNGFGGTPKLRRGTDEDWQELPVQYGFLSWGRGVGVLDMAEAIRTGRPHRASGKLAAHVVDIMQAFHDASGQGRHQTLEDLPERPEIMPKEGIAGVTD